MSYTTGTANDMTAVRQALIDACVAEGWSWNAGTEVLSHGTIFVRLSVTGGFLKLYGRTGAALGESVLEKKMGPVTGQPGSPLPAMSWPLQYRIFVFAHEVYCVIQYAVDTFQWCAFGKSTVLGLPGIGTWVDATSAGLYASHSYGLNLREDGGVSDGIRFCPAPFWANQIDSGSGPCLHSDLDGRDWDLSNASTSPPGILPLRPLLALLPNRWNSESILLPIRAYAARPSNKVSLVADLEHARHLRLDNHEPGQVIALGPDRWMVFPFFRKNTADRNCGNYKGNHTGTFGWAIRYEGA